MAEDAGPGLSVQEFAGQEAREQLLASRGPGSRAVAGIITAVIN